MTFPLLFTKFRHLYMIYNEERVFVSFLMIDEDLKKPQSFGEIIIWFDPFTCTLFTTTKTTS